MRRVIAITFMSGFIMGSFRVKRGQAVVFIWKYH